MAHWSVQSLQLVWFKTSVEGIDAGPLFATIYEDQPGSIQSNRIPSQTSPFFSQATSTEGGIQRSLQVSPGRIDCVLAPIATDMPLPLIGDNPEVELSRALEMVAKGRAALGSCTRVALVLTLFEQMPNLDSATARGCKFVGIEYLPDASDLFFQMNRRKTFQHDAAWRMNRLVKVSSVQTQGFAFAMGPNPTTVPTFTTAFASQYTLDLNSVPTGQEFGPDEQQWMFEEMVGEALRLLAAETFSEALGEGE